MPALVNAEVVSKRIKFREIPGLEILEVDGVQYIISKNRIIQVRKISK